MLDMLHAVAICCCRRTANCCQTACHKWAWALQRYSSIRRRWQVCSNVWNLRLPKTLQVHWSISCSMLLLLLCCWRCIYVYMYAGMRVASSALRLLRFKYARRGKIPWACLFDSWLIGLPRGASVRSNKQLADTGSSQVHATYIYSHSHAPYKNLS